MYKQFADMLFNPYGADARAFMPIVVEDGQETLAPLLQVPAKRYGLVDVSHEGAPDAQFNMTLLRDPVDKLLGLVLIEGAHLISDELMGMVKDMDYGLLVVAEPITHTIKAILMFDVYSRLGSAYVYKHSNHNALGDPGRLLEAVSKTGNTFTGFDRPEGSTPKLKVLGGEEQ